MMFSIVFRPKSLLCLPDRTIEGMLKGAQSKRYRTHVGNAWSAFFAFDWSRKYLIGICLPIKNEKCVPSVPTRRARAISVNFSFFDANPMQTTSNIASKKQKFTRNSSAVQQRRETFSTEL
jgi:hypothetical protein